MSQLVLLTLPLVSNLPSSVENGKVPSASDDGQEHTLSVHECRTALLEILSIKMHLSLFFCWGWTFERLRAGIVRIFSSL